MITGLIRDRRYVAEVLIKLNRDDGIELILVGCGHVDRQHAIFDCIIEMTVRSRTGHVAVEQSHRANALTARHLHVDLFPRDGMGMNIGCRAAIG